MKHIHDMYQTLKHGRSLIDSNKEVKTRINALTKELTGLSEYEVACNAILIDNVERHIKETARMQGINDSVFSANFGPYLRHVMNLASVVYSTFELKNIISVQPLKQRIGALYFADYTYGSDKGDVEDGENIFSPFGNLKRSGTYVTEIVKNEIPTVVGSGYALAYAPIYDPTDTQFSKAKLSIKFVDNAGDTQVFTWGATGITSTVTAGVASMAKAGVGTFALTLASGALTFTTDGKTIASGLKATYTFNSERAYRTDRTKIPKMSLNVIEKLVTAQPRQLIFETNLLASYDFDKQFGSDLNSVMESAALQEMQNALAYQVLDELWAGAQIATDTEPTNPTSFDVDFAYTTGVTPFIPLQESFQAVLLCFSRMATAIRKKFGRGTGTYIVGGSNLEALLRVIPNTYWKSAPSPDLRGGPYYAGKLVETYDVYINYGYNPEDIVLGYRGSEWFDASYFVGSYLPIMAGQFMMFPDFKGQQGYFAVEALNNMFPHLCVRGELNLVSVNTTPLGMQITTPVDIQPVDDAVFDVKVTNTVEDPVNVLDPGNATPPEP